MATNEQDAVIKKSKRRNWLLIIIFLFGLGLRLYGYDWGLPHHFHPDERQIMYKVTDVSLKDPNPHFFAYGSLPIYFLKLVIVSLNETNRIIVSIVKSLGFSQKTIASTAALFPNLMHLRAMTLVGRIISALISAWTIVLVFLIAQLMYNRKTAYLAAALFALTTLSIQQAHFYIVDTPQTFLIACAIYFMIKITVGERIRDYYFTALFIGLAMGTKISTLPIYLAFFMMQAFVTLLNRSRSKSTWIHFFIATALSIVVMSAVMPYWILDYQSWIRDINAQSAMVSGKITFPYTIQYENTAKFLYMIENMTLWSLGLPFGIAAMIGLVYACIRFFVDSTDTPNRIVLFYFLPVFILNAIFKVKFLRYTLPLLPFLAIFTAYMLSQLYPKLGARLARSLIIIVVGGALIWSLAFVNIYNFTDTRVQASSWVYEKIPPGSHILIESNWDDTLPVGIEEKNPGVYRTDKLEIYLEPDDERKAAEMAKKLEWGDIVILASKRHYGSTLRVPKRYPIANNFYRSLFSERIGYRFVGCFKVPPQLLGIKFDDELADESFSVYEHPKVVIFQKESALSESQILPYLTSPPPEIRQITYDEIISARPATNVGSEISFPVFRWLLSIEILGLIMVPAAFLIFKKFDHKGYPLTKAFGLLVVAYLCWLLPHFNMIPFSQTSILFIGAMILILNILLSFKIKDELIKFFKEKWYSIIGYEILFLTVFFIFVFLKSYNPNIYWSESSMDFGFLNSILRSDYFPPPDPWITGEPINYYYYGHYLAAFLTKLSGITANYSYNLFFATVAAFVALAIGSILITLTRRIWAGLVGILFTLFIGNLDGIVQLSRIWVNQLRQSPWLPLAKSFETFLDYFFVLGRNEFHFRYFRSAHELINPTVHEFPFWTLNFMDLHAHMIGMLVSTFIIALHFVLFRNRKCGIGIFGDGLSRVLTFTAIVIAFGAIIPTNSWDYPTHLLIVFLILLMKPSSAQEPFRRVPVIESAHLQPVVQPQIQGIPVFVTSVSDSLPAPVDEKANHDVPGTIIVEDAEAQGIDDITSEKGIEETGKSEDDKKIERASAENFETVVSLDAIEALHASDTSDMQSIQTPQESEMPLSEATQQRIEQQGQDDELTEEPLRISEASTLENAFLPKEETTPQSLPSQEKAENALHEMQSSDLSSSAAMTNQIPQIVLKSAFGEDSEDESHPELFDGQPMEPLVHRSIENVDVKKEKTQKKEKKSLSQKLTPWIDEMAGRIRSNTMEIIIPIIGIIIFSILLYSPCFKYFSRSEMGVGFVHKFKQTTNLDGFLTMFGLFIFIFATLIVRWWYTIQRRTVQNRLSIFLKLSLMLLPFLIFLTGAWILFGIDYSVLALCGILATFIMSIYLKGDCDENQQFILLFGLMAVAVPAGCEIFYIKDFYQGGEMRRFNTIFKFYMQAWFFFAMASAYLIAQRSKIRRAVSASVRSRSVRKIVRGLWLLAFMILLSFSLVFTILGPVTKRTHDEYSKQTLPLTLDGYSYMKTSALKDGHGFDLNANTYRAIHWLNHNIKGTPTILEASGADYLYSYGRISGNTGLPTVLGWWSHVDQREYKRDTGRMKTELKMMYESLDIPKVLNLLRKYSVEYIYVGLTEKKEYPQEGLMKFAELTDYMTPVYANPDVTIYRVNDYGLNIDYAKIASESDVLKDLQKRLDAEKEQEEVQQRKLDQEKEEKLKMLPAVSMYSGGEGVSKGFFNEPRSLAVDSDDNVFVADFRNHRIQKFDKNGNWLMMWGATGEETGQFNDVCDIAVDSDGVYVADTFNNRIQKFSKDGKFLAQMTQGEGTFFYPRGITTDGAGHIYLADTGHSRIVKLKNTGEFVKSWGKVGKKADELDNPIGISFSQGKVYVVDTRNLRIQLFDPEGAFINSIPVSGWAGEVFVEPYVTIDSKQRIWVSDPTANRILALNEKGEILQTIETVQDEIMSHPMGLKFNSTGDLLIVDVHNHRIRKFTPKP